MKTVRATPRVEELRFIAKMGTFLHSANTQARHGLDEQQRSQRTVGMLEGYLKSLNTRSLVFNAADLQAFKQAAEARLSAING